MDKGLAKTVERWRKAGLITVAQAEAITDFEKQGAQPAPTTQPRGAGHGPSLWKAPGWGGVVHAAVNPPFARRPPFFISARLVGLGVAVLAGLALFAALINAGTDLLLAPGRLPHELLNLSVQLTAASLGLAGGVLMWSRHRRGKRFVVASLLLDLAGNAIPDPHHLIAIDSLLQVLLWLAIYYLVVISRYGRPAAAVT